MKIKREIEELGGLGAIRSGEWLLKLVQKSFNTYYESATPEFFAEKYPGLDQDGIYKKLRQAAVRQSSVAGAGSGLLVSANEVFALMTAGEGGIGIPGNIAAALLTMAVELVVVTRIQLELVLRIARLYGVPLNLSDPEDIWMILAVALGGELAQEAGKYGIKTGAHVTRSAIKEFIKGEVLDHLKRLAAKVGMKLLRRKVISTSVPIVSIALSAAGNGLLTGRIASAARKHFKAVAAERNAR